MSLISFQPSFRRAAARRRVPALSAGFPAKQRGLVLLVALIVLVAMTLAATTLIRSVDTTNLIAGNLAFHEAAVYSGERGNELALLNWLSPHGGTNDPALNTDNPAAGYFAMRQDPEPGVSWDTFWNESLKPFAVTESAKDAAGNTVSYVIHRLCDAAGAPTMVPCFEANLDDSGSSMITGGGGMPIRSKKQVYYRVTTRVAGPRNTVAFLQTFIAL
jgi:Tfp pilus assembly protein PilX